MLVLSILFVVLVSLIILILCYKNNLIKMMLVNCAYSISVLFLIYYIFNSQNQNNYTLLDIVLIYSITSFIVNLSLINFYKNISAND